MAEKERLVWKDCVNGLTILLVVCAHNGLYVSWESEFNRIIGVFDMPLFFVTAGYVFSPKPNIQCLKKNAHRLLTPYFFTSAILILWNMFSAIRSGNIAYTARDYLVSWISGYGFNYRENILSFGALWFLTAIFVSTVVFNFILNICKDVNTVIIVSVTTSLVGYVISRFVLLPFNIDIGLYAIIFECFGYILNKCDIFTKVQNNRAKKLMSILISFVAYTYALYLYGYDLNTRLYTNIIVSTLGALAGSYLFILIIKDLVTNKRIILFLSWCGKSSLTILCLHILEHVIIEWYRVPRLCNHFFILVFLKISLILFGVTVIKKIPIINRIYGEQQRI